MTHRLTSTERAYSTNLVSILEGWQMSSEISMESSLEHKVLQCSSPLVGLNIHTHPCHLQLFKGVILHPDRLGAPTCPKEWVTSETSK